MRWLVIMTLFVAPLLADTQSSRAVQATRQGYLKVLVDSSLIYGVQATGSMKPTFDEHYYLLALVAKDYPWALVKADDVVLAWETINGELELVCHRVLSKSSGGSVAALKGDNNLHTDSQLLTEANYVGLVVGWVRKDMVRMTRTVESPRFVLDGGAAK